MDPRRLARTHLPGTVVGVLISGLVFSAALLPGGLAGAQELPLKRDIPRAEGDTLCPPSPTIPSQPTASEASEASRLGNAAAQAQILGDQERARELLSEAAEIDPTAQHIAYLLARTLEALGELERASHEYCRYLALNPDPASAAEVEGVLESIAPPTAFAVPDAAVEAFRDGVEQFDAERMEDAEVAFSDAVAHAGDWGAAYYNRGLARLNIGQTDAGLADLRRYLELEPAAEDRIPVLAELGTPRQPSFVPGPSRGRVFLAGLIPGMGHLYTDRPWMGVFVLGLAGGSAAAGFLHEERSVECLTQPTNGICPPGQVRSESTERPYLAAGLGAAAAITLLGALDAVRGVGPRDAFVEVSSGPGFLQVVPTASGAGGRASDLVWLRFRH